MKPCDADRECEQIRLIAVQRAHDSVSTEAGHSIDVHVADCDGCRAWVGDIQAIRTALIDRAQTPSLPVGFAIDLAQRSAQPLGVRKVAIALALTVAAALILAVIVRPWDSEGQPTPKDLKQALYAANVAEHIHASRLFFRQASKVSGSRADTDLVLVYRELEATKLKQRNEALGRVATQPDVHRLVADVREGVELLEVLVDEEPQESIRRIREYLASSSVLTSAKAVESNYGVDTSPCSVTLPIRKDDPPELADFLEARQELYNGHYLEAGRVLATLVDGRGPYSSDAAYWLSEVSYHIGDFGLAIHQILTAARGDWADRETAGRIKDLCREAGAILLGRRASEVPLADVMSCLARSVVALQAGDVLLVGNMEDELISECLRLMNALNEGDDHETFQAEYQLLAEKARSIVEGSM